uniref:Nucleosome assembly protein n=1 Tax=Physcomitrium patens TaxID=3218 RepID=A0A2K1KF93_PHYPA|nr:hypothetical protein PHYPA_008822 [Physcomitrium patens]
MSELSQSYNSNCVSLKALSDVDRETRVNVLKEKLQSLAGNPSGFLEKLPPKPKRRVIVLEGLQAEHDELEAKFKKERAALEAKCQKLYEEFPMLKSPWKRTRSRVPEFWLTAMNNEIVGMQAIEWNVGKNLTEKVMKKKAKKGAKNTKPVAKTEQCESFFNFFSPPRLLPEDDVIDQEAGQLQDSVLNDYDIGGALDGEDYEDNDDDEEGDDEDEDEDEDDDEEDDDEEVRGRNFIHKKFHSLGFYGYFKLTPECLPYFCTCLDTIKSVERVRLEAATMADFTSSKRKGENSTARCELHEAIGAIFYTGAYQTMSVISTVVNISCKREHHLPQPAASATFNLRTGSHADSQLWRIDCMLELVFRSLVLLRSHLECPLFNFCS